MGKEHAEERLGAALVEWVEACPKPLGWPPLGPCPREALGTQMAGSDQRGALPLGRGGHCDVGAWATPPHVGRRVHAASATHRPPRLLRSGPAAGLGWGRPLLPPGRFLLRAGSMARQRCRATFIDPATRLSWAAHRRGADVARGLHAMMTEAGHGPAVLNRPEVAGTLGQQRLPRCGDALACGGGTSRWGGAGARGGPQLARL